MHAQAIILWVANLAFSCDIPWWAHLEITGQSLEVGGGMFRPCEQDPLHEIHVRGSTYYHQAVMSELLAANSSARACSLVSNQEHEIDENSETTER